MALKKYIYAEELRKNDIVHIDGLPIVQHWDEEDADALYENEDSLKIESIEKDDYIHVNVVAGGVVVTLTYGRGTKVQVR